MRIESAMDIALEDESNETKDASPPSPMTIDVVTNENETKGSSEQSSSNESTEKEVDKVTPSLDVSKKEDATNNRNPDGCVDKDFGKTFKSSAKDAVAKAMELAKASNKQPSMEVLRDLIHQNPQEFWECTKPAKSNPGVEHTDVVPAKKRHAKEDTTTEAKRRKNNPQDNPPRDKAEINQQEGRPSRDDIETLRFVRRLLEDSLQQMPKVKSSDFANQLLKQIEKVKPQQENLGDATEDNTEIKHRDLAHKVTLAFARDLSGILKAVDNATTKSHSRATSSTATSSSTTSTSTTSTRNTTTAIEPKAVPPPKPAVETSLLLCEETDIAQLLDDGDASMEVVVIDDDSDDDEIVEISQYENFVQHHLVCNEEEGLFGKPPSPPSSVAAKDDDDKRAYDLLLAQKVAILRETNRLIRAKTLVLTKRRLGIQEEE